MNYVASSWEAKWGGRCWSKCQWGGMDLDTVERMEKVRSGLPGVFMVDFSHPRRSNGMNQNGKMRQKIGTNPAVSLLKLHLWEFLPVWTSGNLTNLICRRRSTLKKYRHRWKYCPEASPWKYKFYGTKSWENKNCKVFKQRFHHIDDVWKIWHLNLPALSLVVEPVSLVIVVVEPFSLLRCVDTFVTSVKVACNVTSVRWNILTVL